MNIRLQNLGKRYNREWIFRGLNYEFKSGNSYAITGPNGSGKSTLLQVMAGATAKTEGMVMMEDSGRQLPEEEHFSQLSLTAPYLELIEEMTAIELLTFHQSFKPIQKPIPQILEIVNLADAGNKQIRYFSSGMKQRLKLAQAIFSASPILLLDEPTTNLDAAGILLYKKLIGEIISHKLVIVCSNDPNEYDFCREQLSITDFKNRMHTTRQPIAK